MKASDTLYFILAVTASASSFKVQARSDEPATLALSNDLTRSYGSARVAKDGLPHSIGVLFASTPINVGGQFKASSAQLTAVPSGVTCVLENDGEPIATLTEETTYADLDGNPNKAIPIDLSGSRITCTV
ncbi:hypothetical protein N7478_000218 [Penicillium angulare]|uniref:uncharacterized protein n=1 Tax=Penicillium angulare TaxID=116970 RepID=UPI00253FD71C|nr:uncharacterized protein N7478_000218 [Penicillium angulare]KAJ5290967.1 hypothetical protein N7478_000218 [Penicillium angulare]